jgi:hypothetical protein
MLPLKVDKGLVAGWTCEGSSANTAGIRSSVRQTGSWEARAKTEQRRLCRLAAVGRGEFDCPYTQD